MRIYPNGPPITTTEERMIRDQIDALRAKLPKKPMETREPLHALVVRTYLDGASHSRPMDLNNDWSKAGHGIREAIKQGAEVVVRPLYPGEQVQEQKYYPGRERLKMLEEFVARTVQLASGPHGASGLYALIDEARDLMEVKS